MLLTTNAVSLIRVYSRSFAVRLSGSLAEPERANRSTAAALIREIETPQESTPHVLVQTDKPQLNLGLW